MKTGFGRRVSLLGLALVALASLFPATAAAGEPTLTSEVIQTGLSYPWDVDFTPDGKMLVTERGGTLRIYASGEPGAPLLRTDTVAYVRAQGESGLMGIAVDRQYATNQRIYVCVSRSDYGRWLNQVIRYRIDQYNRLKYERFVIRFGMAANTIHNGCALEMRTDGMLWVGMGDANNPGSAQNLSSYNGKILRVTPDGGIPADNPIIGGRRTLIFSLGHRNPQGITTRRPGGAVYSIEHGPSTNDEINRVWPGGNFGWPCYTGNGVRNAAYPGPCGPASAYRPPAWSSGSPTWATSNGFFLDTPNWGTWNGHLIVATLKESDLRHFVPGTGINMVWDGEVYFDDGWRKRAVVRGPGNTLFYTTSNGTNDRVVRVTPSP
jgi:glucose/arabinose dehydrogenase